VPREPAVALLERPTQLGQILPDKLLEQLVRPSPELDRGAHAPGRPATAGRSPPPHPGYGLTLWRAERARAARVGGLDNEAIRSGQLALEEARDHGFGELELYAALVLGGDELGAMACWRTLRARSRELGDKPGVQEASGRLPERTEV